MERLLKSLWIHLNLSAPRQEHLKVAELNPPGRGKTRRTTPCQPCHNMSCHVIPSHVMPPCHANLSLWQTKATDRWQPHEHHTSARTDFPPAANDLSWQWLRLTKKTNTGLYNRKAANKVSDKEDRRNDDYCARWQDKAENPGPRQRVQVDKPLLTAPIHSGVLLCPTIVV